MPSAKANFILNSDVYSIHAVNVIDSHHLGLISEPLARSYLATLAEGALNAPKGEHEMDVVDRVWREWAKSVSSDTREAVKLARNSEWGTAMVDAAFKRRFAATFSALSASAAKITKS